MLIRVSFPTAAVIICYRELYVFFDNSTKGGEILVVIGKMKAVSLILSSFIVAILSLAAGWILRNHNISGELAQLVEKAQAQQTHVEVNDSQIVSDFEDQLKQKDKQIEELESKIEALEKKNNSGIKKTQSNRPIPVRTFLGNKFIGNSEIVMTAGRIVQSSNGGKRVIQEPVVRLPSNFRELFTKVETKVVEKEVPMYQSYYQSNNYNDYRGFVPFRRTYYSSPQNNTSNIGSQNNLRSNPNRDRTYKGNPYIINDEINKPRVPTR